MNTPTRKTSEDALNQFNIWMRSQPWFVEFHKQKGLNPSGNGNRKLSRDEQSQLESLMRANGVQLPDGMHIDSGGSLNQKNRLGRNVAIGAGITAATLATMGAAGVGPMAGMFGTSAPVAGGTAALGAVPEATFTSAAAAFPGATAITPTLAGTTAAGAALPTVGSRMIGNGMSQAIPGAQGITTGSGGGGLMNRIGNMLRDPRTISAAGRMIGATGQASAENRGAQTAAMMDYEDRKRQLEQSQLLAEKSGREGQSDAMNKALWGEYTANYQPLSRPEGIPSRTDNNISDNAREAGRMLSQQARDLMATGKYTQVNPTIRPFEDFPTEPGLMERVGNYAGPALNYYDLYNQLFGQK